MRTAIAIVCLTVLCGCELEPQNEEMKSRIPEGETTILTDADGNRYSAIFFRKDLYRLRPIKETTEDNGND